MNLVAFQSLRNGLQRNAAPATSQVRKVVEAGLREELLASGLFDDVEVGSCEDGERLLVALCTYRGRGSIALLSFSVGFALRASPTAKCI